MIPTSPEDYNNPFLNTSKENFPQEVFQTLLKSPDTGNNILNLSLDFSNENNQEKINRNLKKFLLYQQKENTRFKSSKQKYQNEDQQYFKSYQAEWKTPKKETQVLYDIENDHVIVHDDSKTRSCQTDLSIAPHLNVKLMVVPDEDHDETLHQNESLRNENHDFIEHSQLNVSGQFGNSPSSPENQGGPSFLTPVRKSTHQGQMKQFESQINLMSPIFQATPITKATPFQRSPKSHLKNGLVSPAFHSPMFTPIKKNFVTSRADVKEPEDEILPPTQLSFDQQDDQTSEKRFSLQSQNSESSQSRKSSRSQKLDLNEKQSPRFDQENQCSSETESTHSNQQFRNKSNHSFLHENTFLSTVQTRLERSMQSPRITIQSFQDQENSFNKQETTFNSFLSPISVKKSPSYPSRLHQKQFYLSSGTPLSPINYAYIKDRRFS